MTDCGPQVLCMFLAWYGWPTSIDAGPLLCRLRSCVVLHVCLFARLLLDFGDEWFRSVALGSLGLGQGLLQCCVPLLSTGGWHDSSAGVMGGDGTYGRVKGAAGTKGREGQELMHILMAAAVQVLWRTLERREAEVCPFCACVCASNGRVFPLPASR